MLPFIVPHPPQAPDLIADDLAQERRMEGVFQPVAECRLSIVPTQRESPGETVPERRGILESRRRRRARLEARR